VCEHRAVPSGRVRRVGRLFPFGCVVALVVLGFATTVPAAANDPSAVVPSNAAIGGHTYAQWEARAWQWAIANLRFFPSAVPRPARCATVGQAGPVWFLDGDLYEGVGDDLRRTCDVPAGRYIFIDEPSAECSTVEPAPFHATTDAGLMACARALGPFSSTLTLDGRRLVWSGFDVASPVFHFTMPPRDNYLLTPGATHGRGAAYGEAVMLRPLTPGAHTLVRTQSSPDGPTLRWTYELTVG
jgi:hypothetical protein